MHECRFGIVMPESGLHGLPPTVGEKPVPVALFTVSLSARILSRMTTQIPVADTFTLSGDREGRIVQLLRITQEHARTAQLAASPRMQDALVDLEDSLSDLIASLEVARQEDWADAEYSGEAARERQRWQPARMS